MGRVRSRFLRAVVESVQQETSGTALARLRARLPAHLLRALAREVLGTPDRHATLDLDTGIELLLAMDEILCGGSGVVTVRAMASLASRVLSQSSGLVVPGDTLRTLQHLRAPFEQPFVEPEVRFAARASLDGFVLELELPGRPRAVHWLQLAGKGYATAAAKFSGSDVAALRLFSEASGDVARITGRRSPASVAPAPFSVEAPLTPRPAPLTPRPAPLTPRPAPLRRRSSPTNAAAQVDEILSRATSAAASGVRPAQAGALPRTRRSAS